MWMCFAFDLEDEGIWKRRNPESGAGAGAGNRTRPEAEPKK